jgi:lactoylglutathione lyase
MNNPVLSLVVIRSGDLERSVLFYRTLGLEFVKHRHGAGAEHFACELGQAVFEIYPRSNDTDSTSATRIGFRVPSVDDAVTRLEELGVQIISPPQESPWGRRAVVIDPDGHKVELTRET